MPFLETPEELAEYIADLCGMYGCLPENDHPEGCQCRICFCLEMQERIRKSIINEKLLGNFYENF